MAKHPSKSFLFEASWEVCNKVGGIHTVLTTKLAHAEEQFPEGYCALGPYVGSTQPLHEEPLPSLWQAVAEELGHQGITLHYGRWLVDGEPMAILLDWQGLNARYDEFKTRYWEAFQLDTLGADINDFGHPFLWSIGLGLLVEAMAKQNPEVNYTFQGHEWMTGGAHLHLKQAALPNVRTVFTTHATVLGRAVSATGRNLYAELEQIDPEPTARERGVLTKHQFERLAATHATIFTTVSEITGREATAFLGRKPDVITENGLDLTIFPDFEDLALARPAARHRIDEFVASYFFPSYQFDLTTTSYQFTMGRYEAHNKGYDLYLEALGKLNEKLQAEQSKQTIISFFFVPGDFTGLRPDQTLREAVRHQLKQLLREEESLRYLDWNALWEGSKCSTASLSSTLREQIEQLLLRLPAPTNPPLSPYDLRAGDNDEITRLAHQHGLDNRRENPVKVIFIPTYLDGFDGLFNLPLYRIFSGCDLGVFPSCYEPWGYTPMESLAMAIPAITSDLAGFGLALAERQRRLHESTSLHPGTVMLHRDGITEAESSAELTQILEDFATASRSTWLDRRISAYLTIRQFDWQKLYANYREAYRLAWET